MMPAVWFCLVTLAVAGYIVLDGFDLGAGFVSLFVARGEGERGQVLGSIRPFRDGNEVWLLAAGGTLYFVFPALYASALSGFYLAIMILLWLVILRGIAAEFRSHIESPMWKTFWDVVFGGSSVLLTVVLGVALGNVVRGVPLDSNGYFFLPLWTTLQPGANAGVLDWYTLLIGITSFAALAVHGCLWVVLKTAGPLEDRSRFWTSWLWWALAALTALASAVSFFIQPHLAVQFRDQPWGLAFPLLATLGLAGMKLLSARRQDRTAFVASCLYLTGMLASVTFGVFPNVLPSNIQPDFSLTIQNASAGQNGLEIGLWWWIPGMALASGYFILLYRKFAGKLE